MSDHTVAPDPELPVLKLSAPEKSGYWEVPVLFEDAHLMALAKPAGLLTSPDRYDPDRPNLMRLLHTHIARKVPWAADRKLGYLSNAHRLDRETSGIILLAKSKEALVHLANQFGAEKPEKRYFAIVHGVPREDAFTVDAKVAAHPTRVGVMRISAKEGKRSLTEFRIRKRYLGVTAVECLPRTGRTHQIRVHLQSVDCPIIGDRVYGGGPLWLSELKRHYRVGKGKDERPLLDRVALHAEMLVVVHPMTGETVRIECPLPRDLRVALKYLDKYAPSGAEG